MGIPEEATRAGHIVNARLGGLKAQEDRMSPLRTVRGQFGQGRHAMVPVIRAVEHDSTPSVSQACRRSHRGQRAPLLPFPHSGPEA